jgi:hypothetical protein
VELEVSVLVTDLEADDMMTVRKSLPVLSLAYGAAITVLAGVILGSVAFAVKASTELLPRESNEQSPFAVQLATARHIRQVLAKPLPQPEPLAPITAKRANPVQQVSVHVEKEKKRQRRRLPQAALNSLAMQPLQSAPTFVYPPYDRFAPN